MELGLAGIPAAPAALLFRENPCFRACFIGNAGTLRSREMQRRVKASALYQTTLVNSKPLKLKRLLAGIVCICAREFQIE